MQRKWSPCGENVFCYLAVHAYLLLWYARVTYYMRTHTHTVTVKGTCVSLVFFVLGIGKDTVFTVPGHRCAACSMVDAAQGYAAGGDGQCAGFERRLKHSVINETAV